MPTQVSCSQCQQIKPSQDILVIDEARICTDCFYEGETFFKIYPIGFVCNDLKRTKGFGVSGRKEISKIELLESQEPFLYRLEDESSIVIVCYLHESKAVQTVFNRGLDGKKVGVFASRTPDRPSRIAIQDVELVRVEGNGLFVKGLDAINGSPVLDIKLSWNR